MKLQKSMVVACIIVLMLSMVYATWISHRQRIVYTVDLGKITRAQMLFAGRLLQGQASHRLWMTTIDQTTARVQTTIRKIAADHLVIVTPAVIQGGVDITDRVLSALGLPTHIPRLRIPKSALMGAGFAGRVKTALPAHAKAPAWTLP